MSWTVDKNGKRYVKLVCVTKDNRNKFYEMSEIDADWFLARWGRIEGGKVSEKKYPISDWESIYREKTQRKKEPYSDMTDLMVVESAAQGKKKSALFREDRPKEVVDFAKELQRYANQSVEENYTVSSTAVSQRQIDRAQELIDRITGMLVLHADADPINDLLTDLYRVIPRKMKHVRDHLLETDIKDRSALQAAKDLLGKEQDTLDVMAGQVIVATQGLDPEDPGTRADDLLERLGLDLSPVSVAEKKNILSMLAKTGNDRQYIAAFKTNNMDTSRKFEGWVKKASARSTDLLWHGSRNENWWFILQQGLRLKPATAVITGKMFGYGTYFADKSQKSIGYTSLDGSYFARGSSRKAILSLYDVHVGKMWDVFAGNKRHSHEHTQLTYDKVSSKGYDSVFAKGGYDLKNNEFIVYHENQSNIRYMVQISS
jgi:poly [ADP-ribose] polymerase